MNYDFHQFISLDGGAPMSVEQPSYGSWVSMVRREFEGIHDLRQQGKVNIPLVDHLMSAFGIFAFKFSSLLKFDRDVREDPESTISKNFHNLFGVEKVPDDSNMRQAIDIVTPNTIKHCFKSLIISALATEHVKQMAFYRNSFLLAVDGTGFFSSSKVNCENCCVKNHRDGTKSYYHQMLVGAIVHPDFKLVIPFAPEPILKQDGTTKNDCERNASKRFLNDVHTDLPDVEFTVVEDGISSNIPNITEILRHNMHFILMIKPGDHKSFFERVALREAEGLIKHLTKTTASAILEYRYANGIQLNEQKEKCIVNFIELKETNKKTNKVTIFSWVTDYKVDKANVEILCKGGRARWKIENETFNTLKNQGYEFEHNFGHGYKHLSTNFGILMLLAFLVDQLAEFDCIEFISARAKRGTKYSLWESMRMVFMMIEVENWTTLFDIISGKLKVQWFYDSS